MAGRKALSATWCRAPIRVRRRAAPSSPENRRSSTICRTIPSFDPPPFYAAHGIVSIIDVIIKGSDEQPYGILEIDNDQQHDYDQYDINFLTGFANVLAEAVSTAARGAALQATVDRMKALVEEKDRLLQRARTPPTCSSARPRKWKRSVN